MLKQKKILVCEFITGGGLGNQDLPASLVKEGQLMRDALLADVREIPNVKIVTMHDARLPAPERVSISHPVYANEFDGVFTKLLTEVDFVWLIAPESEGVLLNLTQQCVQAAQRGGAKLIGCGIQSVLVAANKVLSYETMQRAAINTPPVLAGQSLQDRTSFELVRAWQGQRYVAKPIDGVGCEGIKVFDNLDVLYAWLQEGGRYANYFVQPMQQGQAASFSMLCKDGRAWLLSVNKQQIQLEKDSFQLNGIVLNEETFDWHRFEPIAQKVAQTLPDALGYVGVDVIVNHNDITVIDINPRLTTSYVGMRAAIGMNTAKLIWNCVTTSDFQLPPLQKNRVEIKW